MGEGAPPGSSADQPAQQQPIQKSASPPASSLSKPTVFVRPVTLAASAKTSTTATMTRRSFFSWLGFAWIAFSAAVAASGTTLIRFLFPNVLFEPASQFKVGYPDEYKVGEVSDRWKSKYGIWVVRSLEGIYALSTICTHLGCTPNWLEGEGKFKCPCHGSGFRISGINFEGPAPRPLERFRIVAAADGQIMVDKSKIFQQEKGEWNDPESILKV